MPRATIAFLTALFVTISAPAEDFIRVASFNIADFGEGDHPDTRDLDFIAKMLVDNDFDLIAIQEVGVKESAAEQLKKLRLKMNAELPQGDPQYFSFITPVSGDERCAAIYRDPVIKGDDIYWLDEDKKPGSPSKGGKIYYRIPVAIEFSAGDFDFMVVIVHLAAGNKERRRKEVKALRDFLRTDSDEGDWIVLGDLNRYLDYGASSTNRAFDKLLGSNWKSFYRLPLLEALTDPDDMKMHEASEDAHSTTVAPGKNLYDQFIITAGMNTEFGVTSPVLGQHVGIVVFDMQAPLSSIADHNALKFKVSDHRVIWIRLRTDQPDDD